MDLEGDIGIGLSVHLSVTLLWFLCIFGQTAERIELKLSGHSNYGTPQAWLTFGHAALNSRCFLTSDLSRSFHTFADKSLLLSWWPGAHCRQEECIFKFKVWKAGIESKGLLVNMKKTKFMVSDVGNEIRQVPW